MRRDEMQYTKLPPQVSSIAAARHFADAALAAIGAKGAQRDTARLLVSELATNVVLHARTDMRLTVRPAHDRVRVEVRDDDPSRPPGLRQPGPMAVNGRGMVLVDALATSWGVNGNERGKTVWFEV